MNHKRAWTIVVVIAVALVASALLVEHLLNADTWRGRIQASLSSSLGRPVQLGHLGFSLLSGSLVARTLSIADDPTFSSHPFLTAKDIRLRIHVLPFLFHRQVQIEGLTIDEPKIALLRGQNGVWNYSSLGAEGKKQASPSNAPLPNLTVGSFAIKQGLIEVGTVPQTQPPHLYSDLNVNAKDFSLTRAFPFSVSGKLPGNGSLQIGGTAGPVNATDASLTPVTAHLSLQHADLVAAGLVEPGQGISGVSDLTTTVTSNGQNANLTGTLHVTQLKLSPHGTPAARPVDLQFTLDQDLRSLSGKIDSATLHLGNAALAIGGTYQTHGNLTTAQLSVSGTSVPIPELETFLPSLGLQLPPGSRVQSGTLTTQLAISGPVTAPTITGPVRVANAQLAGFDLGQKLSAIRMLTGAHTGSTTSIQSLSSDLRYSPAGTQLNNLAAVVANLGSASGNGNISPAGALNFHLLVKLDSSGAGGMASQAMNLVPGAFSSAIGQVTKNGIPVNVAGTTSNPTFTPDLSRLASNPASPARSTSPTKSLGNALGGLLKGH
jgi:AsmA protein